MRSPPVFRYFSGSEDPATTLFVDGTSKGFRGLSHWPGNVTPPSLKRDLSTGIALAFVALPEAEQARLLGDFSTVCNNHYDTDGVLSAFTLLRPAEALARQPLLLDAATTGDFSVWRGPEALAIELSVMSVTQHERSPLAGRMRQGMTNEQRWALGYEWLIEHLPGLLDDPLALADLWRDEHARISADVARIRSGTGVSVRDFADLDLALVSSDRPITSIGLHLAAGERTRVLLVRPARTGFRYRCFQRVESWFELVSHKPAPRTSMQPAVDALNSSDPAARGGAGRWWCTDIQRPIGELGFGDPRRALAIHFGDPDLEADAETRLAPSAVLDALGAG